MSDRLAIAWDEWLATTEGQICKSAGTLDRHSDSCMVNRLYAAFMIGANAAERITRDHIISIIRQQGERFTLTNDLVDAICDAVKEGQ